MDESRHRRWVAHHFLGKVKEFNYQLKSIIEACDESLRLFPSETERSTSFAPTVVFGFSSFANVALTLRDQASTILEKEIRWAEIYKSRHGDFIHKCRNAITHDGHPIFESWVEGRWYVLSPIMRINRNKLVMIPAPDVDARTFCLEFAHDYSRHLKDALAPALNSPVYQGALYTFDELKDKFNSKHIPSFAQEIFENNGEIIQHGLAKMTNDPIAEASQRLDQLAEYCKSRMR